MAGDIPRCPDCGAYPHPYEVFHSCPPSLPGLVVKSKAKLEAERDALAAAWAADSERVASLSSQLSAAREVLREVRGRGPTVGGLPTCPGCGRAWAVRDFKFVPDCGSDCRLAALLREGGEDA